MTQQVDTLATDEPILRIDGLRTRFATRYGVVTAVDGVSLSLRPGECLGVVGESGSGKSVTFASVMGLVRKPGWIDAGSIRFDGRELVGLNERAYRDIRGRQMAMTMQDALSALNPALTVGDQIMEVILAHGDNLPKAPHARRKSARDQAIDMMRLVGIPSPDLRLNDYPHQFSGGMRQRMMIAIALACRPTVLIADEPTTALDVTIQAQVLELIADIRRQLGMSVILITHDLGVVAENCDRVAVMYAGQVVETGDTANIIANPRHPYTRGLLESIPNLSNLDRPIRPIPGRVPELINLPEGCRFKDRCELAETGCDAAQQMRNLADGSAVRCHLGDGEPNR